MRKDGGGGVGVGQPAFSPTPFVVTLVILTLVTASYQLHPYESIISSRPTSNLTVTLSSTTFAALSANIMHSTNNQTIHTRSSISPAAAGPTKRAFAPYGSAAALFVHVGAYDGYYYNQFLVVNDCLHRYRHSANWTFYFDVDEYMYLPQGNSLESVLGELGKYTQFTIEQNPMSSKLCVSDPKRNYSSEWGFEKLVFRNSITGIRRDRKYAIQAKNAYATGVHMSQNVIGPTTHKTESKIRYYHYHDSINVLGEPCREFVSVPAKGNATWFEKIPYLYDDSMNRVADTIKRFEEQTIGRFRV